MMRKGVYRSRDPIRNFKIRVQLETKLSQNNEESTSTDLQMQHMSPTNSESELYTFSWQEKIFSQRERNLYANEANCVTTLQKKYNKEILTSRHKADATKRLFSYVDADQFTGETTEDESKSSWFANLNPLRRRKPKTSETLETMENLDPFTSGQKMFIMASTAESNLDKGHNDTEEMILCSVSVNASGLITVSPDFCDDNCAPYSRTVQVDGDKTLISEYKVFHASNQMTSAEEETNEKFTNNVLPPIERDFDTPPHNISRIFTFLEIVSTEDFEADCLFIQYFLDLPTGWTVEQGSATYGTTQTCYGKYEGKEKRVNFCYPLNFVISHDNTNTNNGFPNFPQLLLHVLSRDSWGCCRTEGYTAIPLNIGCHLRRVSTWRPTDNSPVSELRRFFIGGSLELDDVAYVTAPSTFQGKYLSKLGMRTQSSGDITVRINVSSQSRDNVSAESGPCGLTGINVALGNKPLEASVAAVVEAFHRARRRMVAVRESVASGRR